MLDNGYYGNRENKVVTGLCCTVPFMKQFRPNGFNCVTCGAVSHVTKKGLWECIGLQSVGNSQRLVYNLLPTEEE